MAPTLIISTPPTPLKCRTRSQNLDTQRKEPPATFFSTLQPGTTALFRLYSSARTDHYYTTNATLRDIAVNNSFTSEGMAGYIYTKATFAEVNSYNKNGKDHFYTMSLAESDSAAKSGWGKLGTTGYMLPF
jgi:Repeat of unknown function (DUF5648)